MVDVQARADGVCVKAHGRWHGGHQLVEGTLGGGSEFVVSEAAGLRHEEALQFGVVEARDLGAPTFLQLPAADCSAMSQERNARDAEGFHVAMGGALRDFEPLCDLSCGEATVSLEQHECGEEAVGFHLVAALLFKN